MASARRERERLEELLGRFLSTQSISKNGTNILQARELTYKRHFMSPTDRMINGQGEYFSYLFVGTLAHTID
jgi:hypothetical protein